MSEDKKDVKPNPEAEHINLKVVGQDGSVVQFKIKKLTPLRKLMSTYCDRSGLNISNVRFRFDGQPISETDTPNQLEMEEGDTIEVFQQQTGGMTLESRNNLEQLQVPLCLQIENKRKCIQSYQSKYMLTIC